MPRSTVEKNNENITPEENMCRKLNSVMCSLEISRTSYTSTGNSRSEVSVMEFKKGNGDMIVCEESMSRKLNETLQKMDSPSALNKKGAVELESVKSKQFKRIEMPRFQFLLCLKEGVVRASQLLDYRLNLLREKTGRLIVREQDFAEETEAEEFYTSVDGEMSSPGLENSEKISSVSSAGNPGKQNLKPLKKIAQVAGNAVFVIVLLFAASLFFFMIQSRVTGEDPAVFNHHINVVEGGSMSPTFEAGSLAIVRPTNPEKIEVGEVITYRSPEGAEETEEFTTHRVMEINRGEENLSFITRGDANTSNDARPVTPEQIQGRVISTIPYGGHVLNFIFTGPGLLILVALPALVVIGLELKYIFQYYSQVEKEKISATANKGVSTGESRS